MKNNSIFQKDERNFTRKQMRDQHTKEKYQQWINSRNSGKAYGKMRVKYPIKNGWKKSKKVRKTKSDKWKNYRSLKKNWERPLRRGKTGQH